MQLKIDRTIDLRGEICPFTFVLTKLNLEEMRSNQILAVDVDYPPAVENIPRSVKAQNFGEIISIKKIGDDIWRIIIKKR